MLDHEHAFERGAGRPPRPHQTRCIRAVCAALSQDCAGHTPSNYLVQHATGSGKSLTIAALAHALTCMTDSRGNKFSLVLVVSDRSVLDDQLSATLERFLANHESAPRIERAESCKHLSRVIEEAQRDGSLQRN